MIVTSKINRAINYHGSCRADGYRFMNRVIRADGSKGPIKSNTHNKLNQQYNRCVNKIKVNEEDLELLERASDDTDSMWLDVIINEQKTLYKELEYLEDKLSELDY